VRFATEHAALLEVLFAGKHREQDGTALHEAAAEPLAEPPALFAGDTDGATTAGRRCRASLADGGMLPREQPDATVAAAVERRVRGLAAR